MMFIIGFALWGSTLLIPLFVQTLLGYPAEQAGLALMPGGLLIIACPARGGIPAVQVRSAEDAAPLRAYPFSLPPRST